jgi:hypothetical protein
MTTKFTDSEELTANELINFIRSQASALSLVDLNQLVTDLPALRERFAKIPFLTYPYLSAELEFLALSVEEHVVRLSRELEEEVVAEAAFALLYFQHATDLIPNAILDMGLLDDAIIVGIVLRRQEQAFKAVRTLACFVGQSRRSKWRNYYRLFRRSGWPRSARRWQFARRLNSSVPGIRLTLPPLLDRTR